MTETAVQRAERRWERRIRDLPRNTEFVCELPKEAGKLLTTVSMGGAAFFVTENGVYYLKGKEVVRLGS